MPTVIKIPGAFASYPNTRFGGKLFSPPNTVLAPTWNNILLSNNNSKADVAQLKSLLSTHATSPGSCVVAGHSYGAEGVIYRFMREEAEDSPIDRDNVLFISSGNPERKYNGRVFLRPNNYPPAYPGVSGGGAGIGYGLPPGGNCYGFKVLDIARQYDNWADYPNDWANPNALGAISSDIHSGAGYDITPPLGADGYPENWDDWAVYEEGDVTYLTAATMLIDPADRPLPWLARIYGGRCARNHNLQIGYDDARKRAAIEEGYDRPAPVLIPAKYR